MPVRKFALVSFTNSDSVGIVETKTIATDRDRTRLNSDVWDGNAEVQLTWLERGKKVGSIKEYYAEKILWLSGEFKLVILDFNLSGQPTWSQKKSVMSLLSQPPLAECHIGPIG